MRIKERIIRALGGFTRADVREQVDAAKRTKPALVLGVERRLPFRVRCRQTMVRDADFTDKLTRENLAYRIGAELLKHDLIAFTPVPGDPQKPPEIQAEAWVMRPTAPGQKGTGSGAHEQ